MQVTVEYTAQARRAVGASREDIELPEPATLRDVVDAVARRHGEPLARILFDGEGQVHPSILLFVHDEQVRGDASRRLADRDVVTILSPISGG